MNPGIAVTGLGVVSPAGLGVAACWQRVREGRPTAATDPELRGLRPDFSCRVPDFDAVGLLGANLARRTDRFTQFALLAAREALAQAGLDPAHWDGARVAVVTGSAFGGVGTLARQAGRLAEGGAGRVSPLTVPLVMANMTAGQLSAALGAHGPSLAVCTACASGATAIGVARDLLRSGACDLVLAGGTEAAVDRLTAAAFARLDALAPGGADPGAASRPFDAERSGFVLAEGAALLVLERVADARARGARVLGRLVGYGASADAYHPTTPHPGGAGLELALLRALADAGAGTAEVGHVNAHATGTPLGDLAEARTLHRLFGAVPVTAPKGVLGHTLGAAGAIEAALTVLTLAEGLIPPTANLARPDPAIELDVVRGEPRPARLDLALSCSAGFGGQNAVLAFAAA
ncbi:beta-ketoacyl-[acyl-carrier-protein] synthase family protein [Kitasatospora sp. NBC_01287]|uniref:beta-ketoacyl-[acyl-carrier-protein] synthase family protein n=1 Tax=Kitasatospora sp. NBC_01287 TaxID=2903573 RepID=UPI002258708C|nr:beta-ketoacyl-[acyl-carrier-protein] synthase family protein [Kitasatospora sp. NBC_01287]MCX4744405.1 beta-ketoacyl-[acyl-carrier-protein] synthase family protein [Kitasatospora sp. NBC_01287]